MRLVDVCAIHSGYTARGRLEPAPAGGVIAIQLGDIAVNGLAAPEGLARVHLEGIADRYFVSAGDVLFRSRGDRTTALALGNEFREPALAFLPLLILRPNSNVVTPEYLAWIINQPAAQRHFDSTARGTNMRMIPRTSLDSLELDIPDIETQNKIVAIDALAGTELELSRLAAEKRRTLTSKILAQLASRLRAETRKERSPQ